MTFHREARGLRTVDRPAGPRHNDHYVTAAIDPDPGAISERFGRTIPDALFTPLGLRKGQVRVHRMQTLPGSAPNSSTGPRFAVALHMQEAETR